MYDVTWCHMFVGIERELVQCLGEWSPIPVTYAGGVRSFEDLELVRDMRSAYVCDVG